MLRNLWNPMLTLLIHLPFIPLLKTRSLRQLMGLQSMYTLANGLKGMNHTLVIWLKKHFQME